MLSQASVWLAADNKLPPGSSKKWRSRITARQVLSVHGLGPRKHLPDEALAVVEEKPAQSIVAICPREMKSTGAGAT